MRRCVINVREAIEKRRAYRSLEKVEITEDMIRDLSECAALAPSCFNNQPWRFVFVKSEEMLNKVFETLPQGNAWAKEASMIIAVYSQKDFDCVLDDRIYYLFDTGMAVAFMILRATELGLVAHPIAGYDPIKVKEILEIPENADLITLIIVGKKADKISDVLSEKQRAWEEKRPERKSFEEFCKIV